jgi:hypothetical protein
MILLRESAPAERDFFILDRARILLVLTVLRTLCYFPRSFNHIQALSSGVEHYLDTVGVSGSNPLEPMISPHFREFFFGTRQNVQRQLPKSCRIYAKTIYESN